MCLCKIMCPERRLCAHGKQATVTKNGSIGPVGVLRPTIKFHKSKSLVFPWFPTGRSAEASRDIGQFPIKMM